MLLMCGIDHAIWFAVFCVRCGGEKLSDTTILLSLLSVHSEIFIS